jgi:ArsR family transcriptional regulator
MNILPEEFLKLLSDPTRLRCLMLLLQEGRLCVCELTHALDDIQPKISRHLASLRDAQIVIDQRAGQWIYYQINPDLPDWAKQILRYTLKGTADRKPYSHDLKKLNTMPRRPGNKMCA